MYKKAEYLAELITTISQQGDAFSYVPEFYMESMVDCFHSLRRAVPSLPFTSELPYTQGLAKIIHVFIAFFNDSRIVNPGIYVTQLVHPLTSYLDVRDLLLQSIGVLMQYSEYVTFIETLRDHITIRDTKESIQVTLVRGLLQAFDKKFWVTVTSILLRFWKVFVVCVPTVRYLTISLRGLA
jgi:Kip1 ubiquitination-promoting complex protein 1